MIGALDETEVNILAEHLRDKGLNISINTIAKKPADAIKTALKHGIPWMIFVGPDELSKKMYTVKNLATEETSTLSVDDIVSQIKKNSPHA